MEDFIMGILDSFIRPPQPQPISNGDGYEPELEEDGPYIDEDYSAGGSSVPSGGTSLSSGASIEMRVERPKSFDEVGAIADHLLERKTILLNLEAADKETIRRLIDFLTGVSYAINGDIKKIAKRTYVVTPNNVAVSGAETNAAPAEYQESDESAEV